MLQLWCSLAGVNSHGVETVRQPFSVYEIPWNVIKQQWLRFPRKTENDTKQSHKMLFTVQMLANVYL